MFGSDGTNYSNENICKENSVPSKIVIGHISELKFTFIMTIKDVEGGVVIKLQQDFDSEEIDRNIAHIAQPVIRSR
jgi:hypothetical protein